MKDRRADPVRLAAAQLLLRAEERPGSIDGPLRAAARWMSGRDRRFLWNLVMESVRWRSRLDWVIAPLMIRPVERLDPAVRVILRLVAAQTCVLDKIPDHAATDEGVRLAQILAPPGSDRLVNAVSRRLAADGRARWAALDRLEDPSAWPERFSHPAWMIRRWRERWGDRATRELLSWNNMQAPICVRARRDGGPPQGEPGWVPGTYRMGEEYRPEEDPGFTQGGWTVQDPSESLVGLLPPLGGDGPILDLCAAPGTKTSHLAEQYGARVVGMDRTRKRVKRLVETIQRTRGGCPILVGDLLHAPFAPRSAAGVLVDAPCSNLGVLRRRPDARWNIQESDLVRHAARQAALLGAAAGLVRPGGWLLYSVCSCEPEETSQVRDSFLSSAPAFRPLQPRIDLPQAGAPEPGTVAIRPGQAECDGVYACLLERIGD